MRRGGGGWWEEAMTEASVSKQPTAELYQTLCFALLCSAPLPLLHIFEAGAFRTFYGLRPQG